MFYTILFLLACYNLYTNVKSFIKEHVVVENGAIAEIPKKAYISIGHNRDLSRYGRSGMHTSVDSVLRKEQQYEKDSRG